MRIGLVDVFVDDQDRARDFYSEMLGLKVKDDAPPRPGRTLADRGLAGGSQGHRVAVGAARRRRRGAAGRPARTRNTRGVVHHRRLPAQLRRATQSSGTEGVVFVSEPQVMGYGGVDAVFEDGCGNLLNLHQETLGAGHG